MGDAPLSTFAVVYAFTSKYHVAGVKLASKYVLMVGFAICAVCVMAEALVP